MRRVKARKLLREYKKAYPEVAAMNAELNRKLTKRERDLEIARDEGRRDTVKEYEIKAVRLGEDLGRRYRSHLADVIAAQATQLSAIVKALEGDG